MKKSVINIRTIAIAAAAVTTVAACSDYSPEEYGGNITQEEYKTVVEYTKNFENRYGSMDPSQDWGFEELGVKVESEAGRVSRATVTVNNNELFTAVRVDNKKVDYQTKVVNGQHLVVPGCPSVSDGKYYVDGKVYSSKEDLMAGAGDGPNVNGDVTNDEITYVSNWFRTHKDPKTNMNYGVGSDGLKNAQYMGLEDLNLSSFFVQAISGDYDRNSLSDLSYRKEKNRTIGSNMDKLQFSTNKNGYTHVNNFNAGPGTNTIDQWNPNGEGITYSTREIKWVINDDENERVTDFRYWGSYDSQWHNNYAIMYLEFEKNGVTYKGTYLGFDYEAYKDSTNNNANELYTWRPDGYYNNWIVKISDALPKATHEPDNTTARVICEDLGNTDDFDFNDLVFDVYYTAGANNTYTAHITVQAVGGTLPVYLGTDISSGNELHALMGYSDMKPINVGATGGHDNVSPVNLEITGLTSTDPDEITICVKRNGNNATPTIIPKSKGSSLAPQKICIRNGQNFRWMRESQQIESGYVEFAKWVENKNAFGENGFWGDANNIDTRFLY